ncbi:MAG: tRNA(Ile)-lysidine synthase [Actinomycetota bacterium]|jgi:tRNA(Ile)-lysidine synthase|nr:tRNA(Ile)-lysidine synthase [Actinomycetota bacterium]
MADAGSGLSADRPLGGPGFELYERALATIRDRDLIHSEEIVLVAYSGGPDSTCLLDILTRARNTMAIETVVALVDHGLSDSSEEITAAIARNVAAAGLDIHVARAHDLAGPNLHERAREFRYAFFQSIADQVGATKIATGHTLDDRAETTLARLIHGAGTSGLAGLRPKEGPRVRPLIDARRAETRAYCDDCGLGYFDDPANEDPRFERATVRSDVLGPIEARWGDGAIRAIARSVDRLTEDSDALASLADRLGRDLVTRDGDVVRIDLEAMRSMPRALRRRVLERAVGRIRDRSAGIEKVLAALDKPDVRQFGTISIATGIEVEVEAGVLVLRGIDLSAD